MIALIQLSNYIVLNKRLITVVALLLILTFVVAMLVVPSQTILAGPAPSPDYGCNC